MVCDKVSHGISLVVSVSTGIPYYSSGGAMPWEFHAACPDCSYEWDALTIFETIGAWTKTTPVLDFYCQDCCSHISVATDFDKNSFRNWKRGSGDLISSSIRLSHNVALITKLCDEPSPYVLSLDQLWSQLWCPPCSRKFIPGSIDECPIVCPKCHQVNARSGGCHTQVTIGEISDIDDVP